MCSRIPVGYAAPDRSALAYRMVRFCSILGYVPVDPEIRDDFEKILAGDSDATVGDDSTVTDEALDLLNAHVQQGSGWEIHDDTLYLYDYCDTATTECINR